MTFEEEQSLVGGARADGLDDLDGVLHLELEHPVQFLYVGLNVAQEPHQFLLQLCRFIRNALRRLRVLL